MNSLRAFSARLLPVAFLVLSVIWLACGCLAAAPGDSPEPAVGTAVPFVPPDTLRAYLETLKIDRASRALLEEPAGWTAAQQQLALRVVARLVLAPADRSAQWAERAADGWPAGEQPVVADRFMLLEGRATFVAPQTLSPAQAEIAERTSIDVVRITTADGAIVDILTDTAPIAWPRWKAIDEPASVVGLPLSTAAAPKPVPPAAEGAKDSAVDAGQTSWPTQPPNLLLAATRVAWHPPTPLGSIGMNYGLFDTVVDGQKLVAGDTEAFYAILAAVGRTTEESIEVAAGPPRDVVPMIDPAQKWFATHRGDPVTIDGTVRRATRIEVDDPLRRRQIGADHYWELSIFVKTSLIKINGRLQENYPLVCCVRMLPEGMPTGQSINERVRVSGFAMKRYGYPLPTIEGSDAQDNERQETPLIIGKQAIWVPDPSTAETTSVLGWIFTGLAAVIGLLMAFGAWRLARDSKQQEKRQRTELPKRFTLPGE